jgi:hypothetical protein
MSIAGTSFELCEVAPLWSQLVQRIARTNSPVQVLDRAYEAANSEFAIPLQCDDGLVIMTLTEAPDGTITALVLLAASFGDVGAFKRQEEAMVKVARFAEATRLAFKTDRKGWKRLLGPEWKLEGDVYSRSV